MPLTRADAAALDRNAAALGVTTRTLMENAGAAVAQVIQEHHGEGAVLVLAGTGNNGGDGAVAARLLKTAGRNVALVLAGDEDRIRSAAARQALKDARDAAVQITHLDEVDAARALEGAAVVVDAVLGVGVKGELRGGIERLVKQVNSAGRPVVAVDLPTGHDTTRSIRATRTVTLHDRKAGMKEELCGEIHIADIGIPADATRFVGPGDLAARYPRTARDARKGDNGKVLVIGGGPYTGAPVMSALGAFATGTDLVHLAAPRSTAEVARQHILEAIVHPLEGERVARAHGAKLEELLQHCSVVCLGPGLGRDPDTLQAVRDFVDTANAAGLPLVVDADGLTAFSPGFEGDPEALRKGLTVLTPHAGEFKRLTGIDLGEHDVETHVDVVRSWLGDANAVVLLKGAEDLIVTRHRDTRNRTHHPVLTTGGTGDILAGVTAALIGRGLDRFDAARVAAYLNGAAGIAAYREHSYGVKAGDVIRMIPHVLKTHLDEDADAQ